MDSQKLYENEQLVFARRLMFVGATAILAFGIMNFWNDHSSVYPFVLWMGFGALAYLFWGLSYGQRFRQFTIRLLYACCYLGVFWASSMVALHHGQVSYVILALVLFLGQSFVFRSPREVMVYCIVFTFSLLAGFALSGSARELFNSVFLMVPFGAYGVYALQVYLYANRRKSEKSAQILEAVMANAQTAFLVVDGQGNVQHYNEKAKDLLFDVFPTALSDCRDSKMTEQLEYYLGEAVSGKNVVEEFALEGNQQYFELSVTSYNPSLEEGFVAFSLTEVTLKKYREKAFLKARKEEKAFMHAKSNFMSLMNNEFHVFLRSVVGINHLFQQEPSDEKKKNLGSMLHFSVMNFQETVQNVFNVSKVLKGKLVMGSEVFDLRQQSQVLVKAWGFQAREQNIDLSLVIDDQLPVQVLGEAKFIRQVLSNLMASDICSRRHGKLGLHLVKTAENDAEVTVQFAVEMDEASLPRPQWRALTQAFGRRAQNQEKNDSEVGLGLLVAGKLVELMGGELVLESRGAKGWAFVFDLSFKKVNDNHSANLEVEGER